MESVFVSLEEVQAALKAQAMRKKPTQEEMRAAFERVANRLNWKKPINRLLTVKNDAELDLIYDAVIHYTGSVPEFYPTGKSRQYRCVAAGYYLTVGA